MLHATGHLDLALGLCSSLYVKKLICADGAGSFTAVSVICFICIACQPKHDISKSVRNQGPSDEVRFLRFLLPGDKKKVDTITTASVQ